MDIRIIIPILAYFAYLAYKINKNILIIGLIASLVCYFISNNQFTQSESFDKSTTEFVSVGEPRYGLRGDLMRVRPVDDCPLDCYNDCYNSNF